MISTAVIPAAGVGTRLFPASYAVKKEMFPVIGANGIARPALMWIILEALSAGIERLIVIVQPDDKAQIKDFFTKPLPPSHYAKLSPEMREEAEYILEIGKRIEFVQQREQEGFGHAVWCARDAVGNQPFLLMLGDHLYKHRGNMSCAAQLRMSYEEFGGNLFALDTADEHELAYRGVVGGRWLDSGRGLLRITKIAEKPVVEYAKKNLLVKGLAEDQYLVLFGLYILQPQLFDYLDALIRSNQRDRGEFQFTSALQAMCADGASLVGDVIDGETFDIGQPQLYVNSLEAFRRQ